MLSFSLLCRQISVRCICYLGLWSYELVFWSFERLYDTEFNMLEIQYEHFETEKYICESLTSAFSTSSWFSLAMIWPRQCPDPLDPDQRLASSSPEFTSLHPAILTQNVQVRLRKHIIGMWKHTRKTHMHTHTYTRYTHSLPCDLLPRQRTSTLPSWKNRG